MSENTTWAESQLEASGLDGGTREIVLTLLREWELVGGLTADPLRALEAFHDLAQGHALVPEAEPEVWVQAQPGQLAVRDIVRVRRDAYDGRLGTIHNGRVGRILAIRYGDIIVRTTDDREPLLDGVHYSPHLLEKRIK